MVAVQINKFHITGVKSRIHLRCIDNEVDCCLVDVIVCRFFVCPEKSVYYISPDISQFLTYIIITQYLGRIIEFGYFRCIICQAYGQVITERFVCQFESIIPSQHQFPAFGTQVGCILLGLVGSISTGKLFAGSLHTFSITNIGIGSQVQTVVQESEIESYVPSRNGFPGQVGGIRVGDTCIRAFLLIAKDIIHCTVGINGLDIIVISYLLIS